jgi:glycosyltransferase involved in cell wall biosynthesis
LIPAHNEELLIDEVIKTIRAADYPQDRIEINVIADNCTDQTATRVRNLGEIAHERHDPDNPGKGQALDWVLSRIDLTAVDAVALFDADNLVDSDFFHAMDRELSNGRRCLQGYYGIANPSDSVMTRLLAVTYVMKNLLFNAGKAKLGLSVVLMGTGMVFRSEVLARSGWQAMSIGEDLEQTFCLLESGERVFFVADALTRAQEATTLSQGYTQRQRWSTGRRALNARARKAIADGLRLRSLHRIETGLDILMPTYSKLLNWTLFSAAVCLVATPRTLGPALIVAAALVYQIIEVVVALRLMKAAPEFITALAFGPVFLVWKGVIDLLSVVGFRRDAWTRTERQPHTEAETESNPSQHEEAKSTEPRGIDV